MQIETIFLDIDGTIFFNRKVVASAMEAVQRLQAKGYTVALCTGRSSLHAKPIRAKLDIHHAIYFNGGLTESRGQVIDAHPIGGDVIDRIVEYTHMHNFPLILHTTDEALSFKPVPASYAPILRSYDFPPIMEIAKLPEDNMVFQANVMMPTRFDAKTERHFPECLLYRWHEKAVDLQKGNCNKAVGALALLRALGQSPETALHIGDGGNDIGMFQTVGMSIAMGNADPTVKAHAQMVTDTAEEDGVFNAFAKLQLI